MDPQRNLAGFREVAHTADWALEVWAPDLPGLVNQAAAGMYALTAARLAEGQPITREFTIPAEDAESLLVGVLTELLYLGESETLGLPQISLTQDGAAWRVRATGAALLEQSKEIKAVTYHGLQVLRQDGLYRATIIFDV